MHARRAVVAMPRHETLEFVGCESHVVSQKGSGLMCPRKRTHQAGVCDLSGLDVNQVWDSEGIEETRAIFIFW